jgi:hypothetical protein
MTTPAGPRLPLGGDAPRRVGNRDLPSAGSPVLVRTDPTTTDLRLGCRDSRIGHHAMWRLKGKPTAATAEVTRQACGRRRLGRELAFRGIVAMVQDMDGSSAATHPAPE